MSARAVYRMPYLSLCTARAKARALNSAAFRARTGRCRRGKSGAMKRRSVMCWRLRLMRARSSRRCARANGVQTPADMPMDVLFNHAPRLHRTAERAKTACAAIDLTGFSLDELAFDVLRHPSVGSKAFLVTIGDRTVGGLSVRDPMVGPWQTPVADCAITAMDYAGYRGHAMTMAERAPVAVIDAPASARIAIGEAITNLAGAPIAALTEIKLSANWMAACGSPGQDAALYDAVRAVGLELCPALGLSIPVGKDSLSMRAQWRDGKREREVIAPVSLVVSAFAPVTDVRLHLTPQLRRPDGCGASALIAIDLSRGRNRH